MFEKEIAELNKKLEEIHQKMLNQSQVEAKLYTDVLKKYTKADFDYFQISVLSQTSYGSFTLVFKYNGFKSSSWIPKENRLFDISIHSDTNEIMKVETHDDFTLRFDDYNEKEIQFLLKRSELCLNVKKVFYKHKKEIESEFNKIRNDNGFGNLSDQENLVLRMVSFLRDRAESELKIDEMFANKGYKTNRSVGLTRFDGSFGYADEISFFKNPSGTYTITLKSSNDVISQSQRASYDNLMSLLKAFANA
jgi:hypothetical protein